MTTAATAANQYRAADAILYYALKRRKAQKQYGFRAKSTYGHCIKQEELNGVIPKVCKQYKKVGRTPWINHDLGDECRTCQNGEIGDEPSERSG